jgi:hypothetical protein
MPMSESASAKKVELIPPDLDRCQAERKEGSFMTFGPRSMIRCKNKPTVIAYENKPGKDGLRGSMSLCPFCLAKFLEILGPDYAEVQPIVRHDL